VLGIAVVAILIRFIQGRQLLTSKQMP